MRCLAVCQDELVIRMLDEILLPGFEVEFIVENRPVARRLHEAGYRWKRPRYVYVERAAHLAQKKGASSGV